jgi:hypothetical protein
MRARVLVAPAIVALTAGAYGNEESGGGTGSGGGTRSGGRTEVTDSEIRVGGVVGETNPVGRPKMTDFTADGILPPLDWTVVHGPATDELACATYIHVEKGEFLPVFGRPGKPFVCLEHYNDADLSGVPSIDDPVYL